jgi:hypothetical protein
VNWENPENFAGRIRQTKTGWFSLGVALGHRTRPALGGSNRFGFTGQHRRFLLDGNSSPEPFNSEHRRLLLETAGSAYRNPQDAYVEAAITINDSLPRLGNPDSPAMRRARAGLW